MKKKTLNLIIIMLLTIILISLTACSSSKETNKTGEEIEESISTIDETTLSTEEATALEDLKSGLTEVIEDYQKMVKSGILQSGYFTSYCTYYELQSQMENGTIDSLEWEDNLGTGSLSYEGETYMFTLMLELENNSATIISFVNI